MVAAFEGLAGYVPGRDLSRQWRHSFPLSWSPRAGLARTQGHPCTCFHITPIFLDFVSRREALAFRFSLSGSMVRSRSVTFGSCTAWISVSLVASGDEITLLSYNLLESISPIWRPSLREFLRAVDFVFFEHREILLRTLRLVKNKPNRLFSRFGSAPTLVVLA